MCIYNPVSGGGTGRNRIEAIRERLLATVSDVCLVPTEAPNHAAELARQAAIDGCDLVVVQGGDGTLNEALQGLAGRESPALLALPGGTANVLARETGLPRSPIRAASSLPGLVARRVPLGLVEFASGGSRYFLSMCGAGLDAAIAARTASSLKNRLGLGAFWLRATQQAFLRFPRLRVGGDQAAPGACSLVVISKSGTYGGGLVLTPGASLVASSFEVAQFTGTSRLRYCGYLVAGICGCADGWPGISLSTHASIRIQPDGSEAVPVQVDGEMAGYLPAKVSATSVKLTLMLPPGYGAGRAIANGRTVRPAT